MASQVPIRKTVAPEIPDKLYFRIGDVATLCEVPAYVLRFWETEFPQLKPNKGGTGQRLYRRKDVELALRIKTLLYDQGYTIPGARQVFKNEAASRSAPAPDPRVSAERASPAVPALREQVQLQKLRSELAGLLSTLSKPVVGAAVSPGPRATAMRPMLVLEQRHVPAQRPSPAGGSHLPQSQRDLFPHGGAESRGEGDDWPEPPAAS